MKIVFIYLIAIATFIILIPLIIYALLAALIFPEDKDYSFDGFEGLR